MDVTAYRDVHSYDGAAIERGHRDELEVLDPRPRDVKLLAALRRHKFLTTPQVLELMWGGCSGQAGRRRLVQLFRAGYIDRFRPFAQRGSYPWTYHLARGGHQVLQRAGIVPAAERHATREVYDYRYVLHELHLNAWVLAWRRLLGRDLLAWEGETQIDPPAGMRSPQLRLDERVSAEGLKDPRAKQLRPDDRLMIARPDGSERTFLIEYDRTRRVDKNFEKFRRYDAFACWWWRHTQYVDAGELPYIVFVCQDEEHRDLFLGAADGELRGYHWDPSAPAAGHHFAGRQQTLFVVEGQMQRGQAVAYRVAPFPPGHAARTGKDAQVRGVRLPRSI